LKKNQTFSIGPVGFAPGTQMCATELKKLTISGLHEKAEYSCRCSCKRGQKIVAENGVKLYHLQIGQECEHDICCYLGI
jgi:hypothetical protein